MILVGVVLVIALIFIGFCIWLYKHFQRREDRATAGDVESQTPKSEWRSVFLSKIWPRKQKQTASPTDLERRGSTVIYSYDQPHGAAPAPEMPLQTLQQPRRYYPNMPTISE